MSEALVAVDEALRAAFSDLGAPGSLGEELDDETLLAGLFDDDEHVGLDDADGLADFAALEAEVEAEAPELADANDDEAGVDAPAAAREQGRARERGPAPGRGARLPVLIAVLGVAACALLALSFTALRGVTPAHRDVAAPQTGASAAMTSSHERPVRWAHPGERHQLRADDCRRVSEDVRLCSTGSASIRVDEGSSAQAITLALEDGEIELDGRHASGSIELQTEVGRVRQLDHASRFRVSFDSARRRLHIEVLAGEVEVEREGGERIVLSAGGRMGLGDGGRMGLGAGGQPSEPAALGDTIASAQTPETPAHGAGKAKAGEAKNDEAKNDEAEIDETPATPDQLLVAAQRELAAGDRRDALRLYRILVETHPDSSEGRIARVSLGSLLLAAGEHRAALVEFEGYLDAGGGSRSLVEEARYGRIRCLRALDRPDELRAAIDEFQDRHPSSLHHDRLAEWRAGLGQP